MFCYQCEQTAKGTGCTGIAGVCGKSEAAAKLQDILTESLVKLSKLATENDMVTSYTDGLIIKGLFATLTNVNFDKESLEDLIMEINDALPPYNEYEFSLESVWNADDDEKSLKSLLLFGLRGMAAYAYHARALNYTSGSVNCFFYTGLNAFASESDKGRLTELVLKLGEVNLECMQLLDRANTRSFGIPTPIKVSQQIKEGPFIIVTGHDLKDLSVLLEQASKAGVNVYTHGEMLPAHGYPNLRRFSNLAGNFGTAWQNQQREFADVPAPILFTSNCLMPPKPSYVDRVFTSGPVNFSSCVHIDDMDYTLLIDKAIQLGGYKSDHLIPGINGGETVTTGHSYRFVLAMMDKILRSIKAGQISHIYLVGGCDGAKPGRSYYTDFVKACPEDSLIFTLACGKYRFNDIDLGDIDGIPRLMDLGQCNDSYGAIKIALALSDALDCELNDLPLTINISWYEQKAVSVLLTLLYLGKKKIRLGPTLPAFISLNILQLLKDQYDLQQPGTPFENI